ncbi:MAG: response regulator [Anaerolineae bacterium]|nr:response regulator [Anaerolineae bacterium]
MAARILIVDDEEDLVYFLRQALLLEFPDGCVDLAYSGEEGLSRLAVHAYDLIIADYRMPGFSGLELIKGVRYLDPRTSIILMTAYGSEELWQEAQELGVTHCFSKPFQIDEMLSAVSQLLPGSK